MLDRSGRSFWIRAGNGIIFEHLLLDTLVVSELRLSKGTPDSSKIQKLCSVSLSTIIYNAL